MASLTKTKETYYIRYRINGKQFRKNIGRISRTQAQILLRKFEEDMANHKMGIKMPNIISLAEFFEEYLIWVENNQTPSTLEIKKLTYRYITDFLKESIYRYSPDQFHLQDFTQALLEKYKIFRAKTGVKSRTINIELFVLSNMFNKAKEWGYVVPSIKITKMPEPKKQPVFFSEEEIQLLFKNANHYVKQIIMLGLHTGMRRGEMLNLQWQDVDFERAVINVCNRDGFFTKTKYERTIPISTALREYLIWLKKVFIMPSNSNIAPRKSYQLKYVICNIEGSKVKKLRNSFPNLLKRLNITDKSLHTLRHTFASHLVMKGVDLTTVKDLLGHNNIQTTMIYAHLSDKHKREAVDVLSNIIPIVKPSFELVRTGTND